MPRSPLPAAVEPGAACLAWRIDGEAFAPTWDSGMGAERVGGRWNPRGTKAVYCSLDLSTSILELAVHKGFKVLDSEPHVVSCLEILEPTTMRVVRPEQLSHPAWLSGGIPSSHQQAFGADLLARHGVVILPSAVSQASWSLVFNPDTAAGRYRLVGQERLSIDTRLNPAVR